MNNKRLFTTLTILSVAALFLAACGSAASATPTSEPVTVATSEPAATLEPADPVAIAQDFYEAVNAGDIEAAMALVAEDVKCRGACYLTGKASFQSYIQGSINMGGHVELSDLALQGDKVTYRWEAFNNDGNFVASGVEALQIENGKIILLETQLGDPSADPAPQASLALVQQYYKAIEASDIDKAMEFVSEDYVMTDPTGFTVGREASTAAWKGYLDAGFTFDQSDFKADGNRVTSCYKVYEKGNLIDQGCNAVTHVRDGKIIFDGLEPAEQIWIVQELYELLNAKEVDSAMELTAEDYVMNDPFGTYDREAAAKQWKAVVLEAGLSFNQTNFTNTGNGRVTSCYEVFQDGNSIDEGCGNVTHVREGKIIFDGLEPAEQIWIVQNYYEALNAKNLDLAMAFIAPDAVFINPTGTYEGADAIRESLAGLNTDGITFELSNFRNTSGNVLYDYKVLQGVNLLDQGINGLTVVEVGKIVFDGTEDTFVAR